MLVIGSTRELLVTDSLHSESACSENGLGQGKRERSKVKASVRAFFRLLRVN